MKPATFALLVSCLGVYSAMGQALTLDSHTLAMSGGGIQTISSVSGQNGVLVAIGCTITAVPSGGPEILLEVSAGTSTAQYVIYDATRSELFPTYFLPYLVASGGSIASWGQNVGDTFLIPFGISYAGKLTVEFDEPTSGTGGSILCTVLHS